MNSPPHNLHILYSSAFTPDDTPVSDCQAVFKVDDWPQDLPLDVHSLPELVPCFLAIPSYAHPQLLQCHEHQRDSLYESLNPPHPDQFRIQYYTHDQHADGAQCPSIQYIPWSDWDSHPQPPPNGYFPQSVQRQQVQPQQTQHLAHRPEQYQQAPSSQAFNNNGFIHPAEQSPATESCTSVPLRLPSAHLSGAVFDHRQGWEDLRISFGWREDGRDSFVGFSESEISPESHGGQSPVMNVGLGMDETDGPAMGHSIVDVNEIGMEEDAEGDEDVEGHEDVEGDDDDMEGDGNGDLVQQGQFQTVQQKQDQQNVDEKVQHDQAGKGDEGEDEVSECDSAEGAQSETESEDDDNLSESEKEDDDDFVPQDVSKGRNLCPRSSSARHNPSPKPVPNLMKKPRGRRVPTMSSLEDLSSAASGAGRKRQSAGGKEVRLYVCDVEGCKKCFACGEHLKRHVRSMHTYEKPHKCPYPGCGKDFSRHDNLGQHMRVHKDYVQEAVTPSGPRKTQD